MIGIILVYMTSPYLAFSINCSIKYFSVLLPSGFIVENNNNEFAYPIFSPDNRNLVFCFKSCSQSKEGA